MNLRPSGSQGPCLDPGPPAPLLSLKHDRPPLSWDRALGSPSLAWASHLRPSSHLGQALLGDLFTSTHPQLFLPSRVTS